MDGRRSGRGGTRLCSPFQSRNFPTGLCVHKLRQLWRSNCDDALQASDLDKQSDGPHNGNRCQSLSPCVGWPSDSWSVADSLGHSGYRSCSAPATLCNWAGQRCDFRLSGSLARETDSEQSACQRMHDFTYTTNEVGILVWEHKGSNAVVTIPYIEIPKDEHY